jgi:diguanylate cyclase (GGDEF)-like protein/PAS domain S-box-containing protein
MRRQAGSQIAGALSPVAEHDPPDGLHEARERFRFSFEQTPLGMAIIDLAGRLEQVNDAFCAALGYSPEQLLGLSHEDITHPDDVTSAALARRELLTGAATSHFGETRYLHASGRVIWARVSVALIRFGDGRPLQFIAQFEDASEQRLYERRLQHMADHDPLTGLLNRRGLEREIRSHAARVDRYAATGAVMMLDLDHFKYFNDTQGHSAGDELLVRVAQALRARLRASDVVARLGGDEFGVRLPGGDEAQTQAVAEALLQVVRDEAVPALDDAAPALIGVRRRVSASVGIARFEDEEHMAAEELLINADLAMYQAKEAGGDRWARYRADHHARASVDRHVKWAEEIEYAIARGSFELLAQPVVPLVSDGPAHYELLLRMRDRRGDVIAPGSFLYVAERLGLIAEIDAWVTGRAIAMLAEQRALGRDLRFEVNLCGRAISDDGLTTLIERRLWETSVPPDRLIFEVTETAAVANIARAVAFAGRLSELGCKFALDDFGAGFGSFYYLKRLPFDFLKIDGEFVDHCARSETDRTMISAVVQIARDMGGQTIAERAADRETVEVLALLGVDYGQGFYLGRPAPLAEHLSAFPTAAR